MLSKKNLLIFVQILPVLQCANYQDLIGCYEFLLWVDDKCTIALLGLVRGLMFWRVCLKRVQQDSSIEAITNMGESIYSMGLGLTLEDIVKMVWTEIYLSFATSIHISQTILLAYFWSSAIHVSFCGCNYQLINQVLTPDIQSVNSFNTRSSTSLRICILYHRHHSHSFLDRPPCLSVVIWFTQKWLQWANPLSHCSPHNRCVIGTNCNPMI